MLNENSDRRDPGRAEHELLSGDLGWDRTGADGVEGRPGHDGQRGRADGSKLSASGGTGEHQADRLADRRSPAWRIGTVNVAVVWLARNVSVPETGV